MLEGETKIGWGRRAALFALAPLLLLAWSAAASAQTGTFLDRDNAADVRVVSYNLGGFNNGFSDSLFEFDAGQGGWVFSDPLERVHQALAPDVWAFQEVNARSAADVVNALNVAEPLGGGASWSAFKFSSQVIATRYAISDTVFSVGGTPRPPTIATVDLPDDRYVSDLHLVNIHLKAGGTASDESQRLLAVDRIIDYLRDARTPGGGDDLTEGTPVIVLGDYNTASGQAPIDNLANGDVTNEFTFGPDSPPDWDGSPLTTVTAFQNNITNFSTWTWRGFSSTSLLDYQAYTDSVISLQQAYVLNTTFLSPSDLTASGLQFDDVLFDPDTGFWDHLPLVADYGFVSQVIPEPGALGVLVLFTVGLRRRCGNGLGDFGISR